MERLFMDKFLIIYMLSLLGFLCFSLSMKMHQKQILNKELMVNKGKILLGLGSVFLLFSLMVSIYFYEASLGTCYWIGVMTFSALTLSICLTYLPQKILKMILCVVVITAIFNVI